MCGIVGAYLESPSLKQIETLKLLFVESRVRGRHASGYSLTQSDKVVTRKATVSAETFVKSHFAEVQPGDHVLQLTGHTRYSTSDLKFNQPIQVFDDFALAHNGVVDQRPPVYWGEYGYELTTQNDSELLYQARYSGRQPLKEFPEASMAVCELHAKSGLAWYRNGKRPLYHIKVANGWFICSTADIARRAGLTGAKRCIPGVLYTPTGKTKLTEAEELIP